MSTFDYHDETFIRTLTTQRHLHHVSQLASALIRARGDLDTCREVANRLRLDWEGATAALDRAKERIVQLEADLKAAKDTLDEVQRAANAKHTVIQEWREGLARIEHMAQTAQSFGEDHGPNSGLRQIIDEARRLWRMPA